MLIFNIAAIYKDWSVNKKIFETYRSSKTGTPTIDPLNEVPEDQLEKEQFSTDSIVKCGNRNNTGNPWRNKRFRSPKITQPLSAL